MSNKSEATGTQETVAVYTTQLPNGNLLYAIGVAPREEFGTYQDAFRRILSSMEVKQ